MNPQDQAILESILAKDITSLTQTEIIILRARSPYLNGEQVAKFKSVLNMENIVTPEVTTDDTSTTVIIESEVQTQSSAREEFKKMQQEVSKSQSPSGQDTTGSDHSADPDYKG
jgi:hypothetical protein